MANRISKMFLEKYYTIKDKMKMTLKDSEGFCNKISHILLILFAIFLFTHACLAPIWYDEIDTNALPVISIQYRRSLFVNESDITLARRDFPNLYSGIRTYEDLRSAKLQVVSENLWASYYFPIYSALCVPIKLLLSSLSLDQERCFPLTNAVMIIYSLWFMQRKLNATAKQRLIALVLLMLSPIWIYNNYVNYETFIFSFLTLSLVQYHNKRYKSSAVLLSLAGMPNSTVMAVGIVMVVEYLYRTAKTCIQNPINLKNLRKYTVDTVLYGMCYIPCLIPYVYIPSATVISGGFIGSANATKIYVRILSYLFDPSLGLFTFAPIQLLAFLILIIIALTQKRFQALIWAAFLLGTVWAFSLMVHINCGMLYCARYLAWTYPIIPFFLATIGYETIESHFSKHILYPVMIATTAILLCVNMGPSVRQYLLFNHATEWILQNFPQIYNPYSATFYSRTLHVNGGYYITDPAYYKDWRSDEIRKLIFKADPGSAERVMNDLTGDEASVAYLEAQLDRYGLDGKFHYVNFPYAGKYQVREKTPEERGEMRRIATLLEESDFALTDIGEYQIVGFPIRLKEDTPYKVELTLADDVDFSTAAQLAVDFYDGPAYDRAEQERNNFVQNGRYQYTFYINSGEFDGSDEVLDCETRLYVWNTDTVIQVESFSVTEMEYLPAVS